MNIALLQFYKQMYNKYIINRLFIGSLHVFFPSALFFSWSKDLLMRSTRTLQHCADQNPSTPSSPCLLSDGCWSVRHLCCWPSSFYAQILEGRGGGEENTKQSVGEICIPLGVEDVTAQHRDPARALTGELLILGEGLTDLRDVYWHNWAKCEVFFFFFLTR